MNTANRERANAVLQEIGELDDSLSVMVKSVRDALAGRVVLAEIVGELSVEVEIEPLTWWNGIPAREYMRRNLVEALHCVALAELAGQRKAFRYAYGPEALAALAEIERLQWANAETLVAQYKDVMDGNAAP